MGFIWPYIGPWGLYKAFIEPYLGPFRAGVVGVVLGCLELVGAKTCNLLTVSRFSCFSNNLRKISFLGDVLGLSWDGLGMVLDFLGLSWAVLGPC